VVGLHLVKSASFFRETTSHLGLDLGCLRPHLGGTTILGHDLGEGKDDDDADAACGSLSPTSSSTTTASSVIATLTHSSLAIFVCAFLRKSINETMDEPSSSSSA
jgi:hypothetical protein